MIRRTLLAFVLASTLAACASTPRMASAPEPDPALANPAIDMAGFLAIAQDAADHREQRRLTEDQFLAMMDAPGTIVLDARSAERYAQLHVRGAVNLAFPDIAIDSLARVLPDKGARILIYCNNNFTGNPVAFAAKAAPASLNLSTYATLYGYGYRNVYELGPQVAVQDSKLPFEGSMAQELAAR
jgi:rhodanese-related sulfurtransferase